MKTPTAKAQSAVRASPVNAPDPGDHRAVSGTRTDATMIDRQPAGRPADRVPSGQSGHAPTAKSRHSRGHSHHDGSETVRQAPSKATSRPASYAPTTTSNVKQLVASSRFHDDALCQLLDAARLNLIGGEAKKALNRAARARVTELKDMKARGEVEEASGSHGLKRHHRKKSKDRHSRKSEGRGSDKVGTPERGGKAEAELMQPVTPPQWAQDVSFPQHVLALHILTNSRSCHDWKRSMLGSRNSSNESISDFQTTTQDRVQARVKTLWVTCSTNSSTTSWVQNLATSWASMGPCIRAHLRLGPT